MGRLEDRLLNHPAHERVQSLRATIEALTDEQRQAVDEQAPGTLDRFPKALVFIEGALKAADPDLVSAASMEAIESGLTTAEQQFEQVAASPNVAANLDGYVESALDGAARLLITSQGIVEGSAAITEQLDNALTATVKELAGRVEALPEQITALEGQLQEAAQTRETADQEREASITTKFDELQAAVNTEKERLDSLVPSFQETFESAQTERQSAFDEAQKTIKEAFDATTAEAKEQAQAALNDVEARRKEVERIYGVITETGTAGKYHEEAEAQEKLADRWRNATVIFGCIATGLAIYSSLSADGSSSLGEVVGRVTATLAAFGVAAYAGRQSGRHREREEEAKRLELELVTFPAFIDSLDAPQQSKLRESYIERAFRGRQADQEAGRRGWFRKEDSTGTVIPELVALVRDLTTRREAPPPQ